MDKPNREGVFEHLFTLHGLISYELKQVSRINSKLRSRKIHFAFFVVVLGKEQYHHMTKGMDTAWDEEQEPVV